ncbi:PREDICTED: putative sodium-dependent multivitamin transporter isoform X2 [Trachymyrmex cornetzi]|uniref:putative sodium-dependent multivitamin transporter isoform X2 n=1 Tax=Trachymyrmex cornetzi TaxID=471704 RepID=UPI00084F54A0|nr:PREDICTED: putative sodium-dependent multivitamin transporter isoform X2 [Trachymyrmex cornetzi]
MLCISIGIGIYYRFSGKRQTSVEEYFVASRSISVIPASIAMVATFMGGSGLLGLSAETYIYGTQIAAIILAFLVATPIICYGFLPVFYKLQATSAYEYLERRFGVKTRMVASFVYWLQQLFHSGVVLYAPSLALETTTGISRTISITIIGLVCAFYSSIAANDVGGLGQIWEIARQGQRLQFDSIGLDPTIRHTWWSLLLGGACTYLILVGVNQAQVQRMLTVKNMQASQRAMWLSLPILTFLWLTICFSGLAIYSKYYNCDPLLEKRITSPDMVMPLYVMETMSNIPGVPGLFIAGIFSASLSTISAALNSLAAVTLEDYLKPLYKKYSGHELSPTKSASIVKVLAFVIGIIAIVLAFLSQFMGSLAQTVMTILGVVGSPLLGIFTLGMGTESATEVGAIVGALTSFSFLCWITFGHPRPKPPKLPITIEGCDKNSTNITMSIVQNVMNFSKSNSDSSYFYLYRISYMWYSLLGFLITFLIGLLISNLSRLFIRNENSELDTDLFFPVIARRIRYRRFCNNTKNEENLPLNRRYSLSDVIHEKDDAVHKICTKS